MSDIWTIGSQLAGIGGLDLGAVWATGADVRWQLDERAERVRARHWPHAEQFVGNVYDIDARDLPPVDLLLTGFPVTSLYARPRSLYRESLRFCGAAFDDRGNLTVDPRAVPPRWVFFESPPSILRPYFDSIRADFEALGYALAWTCTRGWDVGLPFGRERVFVLAKHGGRVTGEIPGPNVPAGPHEWLGPLARDCRQDSQLLQQVRRSEQVPDGKLNPEWVEALLGFPLGWSNPRGPSLVSKRCPIQINPPGEPRAPGEPPRLRSDGFRPYPMRAALRRLGAASSPLQTCFALRALLEAT